MAIETKSIAKKLSGKLYDTFFISEYGKIEAFRASRYNTNFSIIVADMDGVSGKGGLAEEGQVSGPLARLGAMVLDSVRSCDIVGVAEEGRILAILPETDYFGSLNAIRKLNKSAAGLFSGKGGPSVVFSQATFPRDGKGFGELLSTAVRRVSARRASLWEKLDLKNRLFWEIIGGLSGAKYDSADNASFDAGPGHVLDEFCVDRVNALIIKELSRSPQRRGILLLTSKRFSQGLPVVKALAASQPFSTKVYLAGEAEHGIDVRNASIIPLEDPRLKEMFFTFFLNEDTGYALICKENWGGTFSCFHSSDANLVEGLIGKFQGEYSLQEQLG